MTESTPLAFWLLAALMAALALAFVLPRLLTGRIPHAGGSRRALNMDVCRGQLADLERERDEGVLSPADYDRARREIERRLVDEPPPAVEAARPFSTRRTAWTLALTMPLAAVALYLTFGTPAALDPGSRVSAADDPAAFRESLARHLARAPSDARSWVMLARADFAADRFADAADSYEKAIAASPKVARDPQVLCELADALGMANGGTLQGRPRELVMKALALNPQHPRALEMAGSAAYDDGDFAGAAAAWGELSAQLPPQSAERRELAAAIERALLRARIVTPPTVTPSPATR
jgi:cytochrome c-type biogenesis protein CcmH